MTFKPAIWFPIAVVLSLGNLISVPFTTAEPWHATAHAVLALAFGLWAQRLRKRARAGELPVPAEAQEALDALHAEVSQLRQELGEAHERLDFVERLLAQAPDARRVGPQR